MKCGVHQDREGLGTCVQCGIAFCEECRVVIDGKNVCRKCQASPKNKANESRKSPGLAAALGFLVPGLGQILNGQAGKAALIFFTSWLVIPWLYGIVDAYIVANRMNKGEMETRPLSIGCLVAFGLGFMAVPVIAFMAAIAIPNLLRAKISANDALAKASVNYMAGIAEEYARTNNGMYPSNVSALSAGGRYEVYCDQLTGGYQYECQLSEQGFTILATPLTPGTTGTINYTITNGGELKEEQAW